jgi:hypothetical protein
MKVAKAAIKTKTGVSDSGSSGKEKLQTFNGKIENWLNSKCELTTYLNQIQNKNGVPIYYVICTQKMNQNIAITMGKLEIRFI